MLKTAKKIASSRGAYLNTGTGSQMQVIDIGHNDYVGLISGVSAFWMLVKKSDKGEALTGPSAMQQYRKKEEYFIKEMRELRFGLKPSAVYFNPTDRCNLNCSYCYIPKHLRRTGSNMSDAKLFKALEILRDYFHLTLSGNQKPQIIFHGAEPMLNKEAIFSAIDRFGNDFNFGIQTNATLLDDCAIEHLRSKHISIGLSLDGHAARIADRLRKTWDGAGVFNKVVNVIEQLRGYKNYSVICTVTKENSSSLVRMIDFLHGMEVPYCMLNPVRCTMPESRASKPADHFVSEHYLSALTRSYDLYKKTGRKIVVANFANVLMGIIAPMGRRLMCDISPCGGGRCFFAVSSNGDMFPCSEFIGLKKFKGGNIFTNNIKKVLKTKQFRLVTERRIENIEPCSRCAIRHFCGAPCPAEAHEMNRSIETPGAFCELYEEQVRYALRLIADDKVDAYLWDNWDKGLSDSFKITGF